MDKLFPTFDEYKGVQTANKQETVKKSLTNEYSVLQKKLLSKYNVSDISELNDSDLETFNSEFQTTWSNFKAQTTNAIAEGYVEDTESWIDKIIDTQDLSAGAKEFLNGLKTFLKENGFLTPAQRKGLAQFAPGNPEK